MKKNITYLTQAAMIAALYIVLTLLSNAFGLANGVIQIRISEALTILPFFTPAAIPGLFIGCLLSNILTGCTLLDIIFGSIATLLGALGTYGLHWLFSRNSSHRRHKETDTAIKKTSKSADRWLAPLPPIIANTLIVPFILLYVYQVPGTIFYLMLTVGIGELISCGILGMTLLSVLYPIKHKFMNYS